jgi:chemosensory pili system protein ChpA (sensor histidine kinase/response regulator)
LQDAFAAAAEGPVQRSPSAEFFATVQTTLDALCAAADQPAPQLLHPLAPTRVDLSERTGPPYTEQDQGELLRVFATDATEAIETSQRLLLELEQRPADGFLLRELFRHFHTLKGAAAAVGLEQVAQQLHHGESFVEATLGRRIAATAPKVVDFLLRLTDSVIGLTNAACGMRDDQHAVLGDVEGEIAALMAPAAPSQTVAGTADIETAAPLTAAPPVAHDANSLRVEMARLDALMSQVGQLVSTRVRMDRKLDALTALRERLAVYRTRLTEVIETFRERFEFGTANHVAHQRHESNRQMADGATLDSFTATEFDRYDDISILARGVIELATDTRDLADQIGTAIGTFGEETFQLSQITSGLQRDITRLRSVPLDTVFRRLLRPARDAARKESKLVDLRLEGADLAIDTSIAERLYAPLLHLVRNAVSHGIEPATVRQGRGKPAVGMIRIAATQHRRSILLSVEDDGGGIDFDAIAACGRARDLIPPGEVWHRNQLLTLIFRPGFSTHATVTDLSGRGMGMDVVARDIAALNGSVTIDSRDGVGTAIRITLPTTTSIDEVLLLQAGTQLFALPVGFIDQVITVDTGDLLRSEAQAIRVRDARVPVLFLGPLVGEPAPLESAAAVILRSGERALALIVDRVQAQHEAAIRSLGPLLEGHPLLSGAVVSGTGAIIFVLHAGRLFDAPAALTEQQARHAGTDACGAPSTEGHAVLFVDDSISVRKVAAHFLETSGLEVDTAVDGLDALEKLETGRFRLVMTDLEMPRTHGYELIAAIRRSPRHRHLPVIVCSSRSSQKHRQRAAEMGAQGYLTKPFTKEQLLAEIQRLTESRAWSKPDDHPAHAAS